MKTIRLFISSPGNVVRERQIAERVVARLNVEFAGRVRLDPYFWEYEPMRLDRNFEDQIPPTSEFDLLICILWSRLGTPLKGSDGREWASGTEYEVDGFGILPGPGRAGADDLLEPDAGPDPPTAARGAGAANAATGGAGEFCAPVLL